MPSEDKIVPLADLATRTGALRDTGERIVVAAGAFDLPHAGQLRFLGAARGAGDALVVLILSDTSVKAYGGADRPVMAAGQRARVLAGFSCVGLVAVVDSAEIESAVAAIKPHTAAVSTSASPIEIDLDRAIKALGGDVLRIPDTPGISTTAIIERIRQNK